MTQLQNLLMYVSPIGNILWLLLLLLEGPCKSERAILLHAKKKKQNIRKIRKKT